ncbi:hypothetical protein SLNWT_2992 [Streptomyces albus]|uniref:Uncharacterized protein n=1 Tax=Streptomyces albus (strain ATCC 21838 / DSM 41398 / FERM P-419 / JCM 4703 / NBRC 107858) TaxID=1081613 RepID=A0A0B5ELT6_STRA4|nr:hypothetical protein SLNWT_2992 [Streptomyces albus]AOU77678.1 hypothetical protein SLNHY_2987 [Streptomyces albus]AYN33443.1 hypothetical protein DUI70_2942 [Streptomyces albus]
MSPALRRVPRGLPVEPAALARKRTGGRFSPGPESLGTSGPRQTEPLVNFASRTRRNHRAGIREMLWILVKTCG